jgi:hypothetical protein
VDAVDDCWGDFESRCCPYSSVTSIEGLATRSGDCRVTCRLLEALIAFDAFRADSPTVPVAIPLNTWGPRVVNVLNDPGLSSGLVYHKTADGVNTFALPL